MNDERSFERTVRAWLEPGANQAPDRAVQAVLMAIETTPQERDLRIPWRFRTMNTPLRVGMAAVTGLLLLGAGIYLFAGSGGPNIGGPAAPTPTPMPLPTSGQIEPGTYRFPQGIPGAAVPFTVTLPDGWNAQNGGRELFKGEPSAEVGLFVYTVDKIFEDACGPNALVEVGTTADDLANALAAQAGTEASGPADVMLGGYPAKRVDLTVPAGVDTATCDPPIGLQIWFAPALAGDYGGEGEYMVVMPDGRASVYMADVGAERLVVTTQTRAASTPENIAELEAVIASITIEAVPSASPSP